MTELTVDIRPMLCDPLDDDGCQRVEKGDRVSVIGDIDFDLIEGRELVATALLTIVDESASRGGDPHPVHLARRHRTSGGPARWPALRFR